MIFTAYSNVFGIKERSTLLPHTMHFVTVAKIILLIQHKIQGHKCRVIIGIIKIEHTQSVTPDYYMYKHVYCSFRDSNHSNCAFLDTWKYARLA